jgi:hypothetical protein
MLRRNLLHATALLAIATCARGQPAQPAPQATGSLGFAARRSGFFAPRRMYGFTADLFTRSHFVELRSITDWSADHPKWASNLPKFSADMMSLLMPPGVGLGEHLAAALPKRMSQAELAELDDLHERPATRSAVLRLERLGASWESLMQVQGIVRAPKLYSSAERARAKTVVQALRGELPEAASLKSDLAPLGEVLGSPAFKKYQSTLGALFMADAGRLESTDVGKRQFQSLMQRWNLRIKG